MKLLNGILIVALMISVAVAAIFYFRTSGSDRLLTAWQQIRAGLTQQEVLEIMGREPAVAPANQVPLWI